MKRSCEDLELLNRSFSPTRWTDSASHAPLPPPPPGEPRSREITREDCFHRRHLRPPPLLESRGGAGRVQRPLRQRRVPLPRQARGMQRGDENSRARHAHVHVEHAPGAAGLGFAAGRGDLQGGGRERGVRDGHTGATHRHTETTLRQLMPRQAVGGHRLGEAVLPAGRPRQQLELRPRLLPRRPLPLRCVSRLGRPSEPHLRRHPDPGGPAPSGARAADWLMIQFSTAQ